LARVCAASAAGGAASGRTPSTAGLGGYKTAPGRITYNKGGVLISLF
jgi:hypothetical protein